MHAARSNEQLRMSFLSNLVSMFIAHLVLFVYLTGNGFCMTPDNLFARLNNHQRSGKALDAISEFYFTGYDAVWKF